jgi:glycosyltransferase involved in cell wall biosynthesis
MPKISILICSYNAGEPIESTLRSCLEQTCDDFEILILDNASTDGTVSRIRSFASPKITLIEGRTNLGPYAGLNVLLERAK